MAAAKVPVWPACWDPWPTNADESAAKLWLSTQRNNTFATFASVFADDTITWSNLELGIKTVTGCKSSSITKQSRIACEEKWGKRGLGEHAGDEMLRSIGRRTAELVMESSDVAWKEEALHWTQIAFVSMAPRLLSLWKKHKRRGPKPELDTEGDDADGKSITSNSTATTSKTHSKALHTKTLEEGKAISKKQRLALHAKKTVSFAPDQELYHRLQPKTERHLVHRTIIVQLDHNTAEELRVPFHVPVGIAAIIDNDAKTIDHEDVRCEHLSWDRFKTVLGAMHPEYRILPMGLFYSVPQGEGHRGEEIGISDEEDFRCAVGMLDLYARAEGGEKLFMNLRPVYRY